MPPKKKKDIQRERSIFCAMSVIILILVIIIALMVAPLIIPITGPFGDFDGDGIMNVWDPDDDGDGILDIVDEFPYSMNGTQPGGNYITVRAYVDSYDELYTDTPGNPINLWASASYTTPGPSLGHSVEAGSWWGEWIAYDGDTSPPYSWSIDIERQNDGAWYNCWSQWGDKFWDVDLAQWTDAQRTYNGRWYEGDEGLVFEAHIGVDGLEGQYIFIIFNADTINGEASWSLVMEILVPQLN